MKRLLPIEWMGVGYCLLTLVFMALMAPRLVDPVGMLLMRGEWLAMTLLLWGAHQLLLRWNLGDRQLRCGSLSCSPSMLAVLARSAGQLVWLSKWYPDTYEFNRSFPNLDHLFAHAEQNIFGCQPSLEFSRALPQAFWSEAFHFGYWIYFPMIVLLILAIFWKELKSHTPAPAFTPVPLFQQVSTTVMACFFLYYLVYIFLPVAGPQFYFQAVGVEAIESGQFPSLGTYFSAHTEMLPSPGNPDGLFYHLVSATQDSGERPTAAFPSSHIGISTCILLIARRRIPRLVWVLLIPWVLLCCATVYIQAHYLVDSIAGLLTAPLALSLAQGFVRRKLISAE